MSQNGAFIGLCMAWVSRRTILGRRVNPAYLEGPPVSIYQVNVDRLTRSNFQKKQKKKPFLLPELSDKSRKCFKSSCSKLV